MGPVVFQKPSESRVFEGDAYLVLIVLWFVLGGDNIFTEVNYSSGACCIYGCYAMLEEYFECGFDHVGLLNDGKDFTLRFGLKRFPSVPCSQLVQDFFTSNVWN
jgi:hypothetical protein